MNQAVSPFPAGDQGLQGTDSLTDKYVKQLRAKTIKEAPWNGQ